MSNLKKKKTKKIISTTKLVNQVLKVDADAQGLTLKEYKRQREAIKKSQEEYKNTHWVNPLTDAQLFFVATAPKGLLYANDGNVDNTNEYYMGKPLGRENLQRLGFFKKNNKGYLAHITALNRVKKLRDGIEKPLEPFKRLQEEYQAVGKRLRSSFLPEQEALRKIWSNLSPLSFLSGVDSEGGGLLDYDLVKARIGQAKKDINNIEPVDRTHGLNTLMKKHKMKSPLDIADHFLKVFEDPKKSDYFVEGYYNAEAFAKACGVFPVKVFELIAREIKKRKKHYIQQQFISKAVACEELVNEWNTRRSKDELYPYSDLFRSKFRIDWSLRHGYDWTNYKRFMEEFPNWVRIFNARAKKFGTKEDAEIELGIQQIIDQELGK